MTDGWGIFSAWATAGGAVATAVSAGIIARQSVQTTRTLRLSARERMDAEMPRLTISVKPGYDLYRSYDTGLGGEAWMPIIDTIDEVFERPKADGITIRAEFTVTIANNGPRDALIEYDMQSMHPAPQTLLLGSGAKLSRVAQIDLTVAEWAIRSEVRSGSDHRNEIPAAALFSVKYDFPGDYGATELHAYEVVGSVLKACAKPNDYQLVDDADALVTRAKPFKRTYWESRSANRELGASWWRPGSKKSEHTT